MYKYLMTFFLLLYSTSSYSRCEIENIASYYIYIKNHGPNIFEINKRKQLLNSKIELAKQRPNPELDFDYLKGKQLGHDIDNYKLTAKHVVELGSKRDRRISKAKTFQDLTQSQLEHQLFKLNSNAVLTYQKAAQLEILITSISEAILTFQKIANQLERRVTLTPKEKVSLSSLKLASSDYHIQLNTLKNQKNKYFENLEFQTGCRKITPKYHKIPFPKKFHDTIKPQINGLHDIQDFKLKLAHKELELQNSLGYSNLKIGPSLQFQNQNQTDFLTAGISLTIDLPLFNTNDAGKNVAYHQLNLQKVQTSDIKQILSIRRKSLIKKYNQSFKAFQKIPTLTQLKKEHHQLDSFFARGIIPISMTIESHRQQIDFLKSKISIENNLLETYLNINLIDGDIQNFENLIIKENL